MKSTFEAKLPVVMLPSDEVLLRIEILFEPLLATTMSNFPSAFKSPDDNDIGEEPVAKSTRDARLDALNKPLLKMF